MTDNSAMKSHLKQLEFANQTPLRGSHIQNGDFYTSQKDKYNTTNRQLSHSLANITNVVLNSEACKRIVLTFFITFFRSQPKGRL